MSPALAVLVAAFAVNARTYEQDGVRIETSIQSQIVTWTVTNVSAPPIRSFELEIPHTYNHHGPDGWSLEYLDYLTFRAEADASRFEIRRDRTGTFDTRVTSAGAVLGLVRATVGFGPDREPIVFEEIWGPVPPPRSIVVTVVLTMILVVSPLWARPRPHATRPCSAAEQDHGTGSGPGSVSLNLRPRREVLVHQDRQRLREERRAPRHRGLERFAGAALRDRLDLAEVDALVSREADLPPGRFPAAEHLAVAADGIEHGPLPPRDLDVKESDPHLGHLGAEARGRDHDPHVPLHHAARLAIADLRRVRDRVAGVAVVRHEEQDLPGAPRHGSPLLQQHLDPVVGAQLVRL